MILDQCSMLNLKKVDLRKPLTLTVKVSQKQALYGVFKAKYLFLCHSP